MDEVNQTESNSNVDSNVNSTAVPPAGADISKTTITILVLLTLMISVIGTWTVLNEVSNVRPAQSSTASGRVSLTVTGPPEPQQPVDATGRVMLNILGESN